MNFDAIASDQAFDRAIGLFEAAANGGRNHLSGVVAKPNDAGTKRRDHALPMLPRFFPWAAGLP